MICSSVNRFRFICPSFNRGRTLTPSGEKTQGQVNPAWVAGQISAERLRAHAGLPLENPRSAVGELLGSLVADGSELSCDEMAPVRGLERLPVRGNDASEHARRLWRGRRITVMNMRQRIP